MLAAGRILTVSYRRRWLQRFIAPLCSETADRGQGASGLNAPAPLPDLRPAMFKAVPGHGVKR